MHNQQTDVGRGERQNMQEKPIVLTTEVNKEEEAYLKEALETELSLHTVVGTLNTLDEASLRDVEILLPYDAGRT